MSGAATAGISTFWVTPAQLFGQTDRGQARTDESAEARATNSRMPG